jgi:hypothetical protein
MNETLRVSIHRMRSSRKTAGTFGAIPVAPSVWQGDSRRPLLRWAVRGASVAGCIATLLAAANVAAEGKTAVKADELRKNSDFRVRTTAALALGTPRARNER